MDGKYVLQVRESKGGRIVHSVEIESNIDRMVLHKNRNLLITYDGR
jgi:hypothetical protein